MKSLQLPIFNYHLSINDRLSFINAASWQMVNGKCMENGKWLMVNAAPVGGARG